MDISERRRELTQVHQEQVLRFWDQLPPAGQARLAAQIDALDLEHIAELVRTYVTHKPALDLPADIQPVTPFPRQPDAARRALYRDALAQGQALVRAGKVGAFLVAGGQGTRLGYDGPKGEYPVTPIRQKPLFQVFAEQLLATARDHRHPIPWYIMTSDVNDAPTREFFERHDYFGYEPENVFFFVQGMMPAFDPSGKILLAEKDSLALSPDGHGGSLRALHQSGALEDMRKRGVEHLSYFQVDNPLVHCIDPLFIGLHETTGSEMSSKTIPKAGPLEKVGNFVIADGRVRVIEYSDLPDALAHRTNADGSLTFNAGSIAIHALRRSFVERLNASGRLDLPWHRADKKVTCLDEKGNLIKPDSPNAIKLEQFVFDAIPFAKNAMIYTTDRAEEFSPVKNAQGSDSPATSRRDQIRRAARWLQQVGVDVPMQNGEPDATLEISPLYALNEAQLQERAPGVTIAPRQDVYLGNGSD